MLLKPGESQRIIINITINDFGYYDTMSHSWKLDSGVHMNLVIASDVSTVKVTKTIVINSKIIEKTAALLSSTVHLNELVKD